MGPAESERLLAGRYRLRSIIGRGGMGLVWRARDELLGRDVAVKEIVWPPQMDAAECDIARRRAVREAQMAARLSHPNVVAVYDIIEEDSRPWLVMELVPHRSLRDKIMADGPPSPGQAARVGLGILAALRAAHEAGVVHRDVKPANGRRTVGRPMTAPRPTVPGRVAPRSGAAVPGQLWPRWPRPASSHWSPSPPFWPWAALPTGRRRLRALRPPAGHRGRLPRDPPRRPRHDRRARPQPPPRPPPGGPARCQSAITGSPIRPAFPLASRRAGRSRMSAIMSTSAIRRTAAFSCY
jgi:Protein kinase domain